MTFPSATTYCKITQHMSATLILRTTSPLSPCLYPCPADQLLLSPLTSALGPPGCSRCQWHCCDGSWTAQTFSWSGSSQEWSVTDSGVGRGKSDTQTMGIVLRLYTVQDTVKWKLLHLHVEMCCEWTDGVINQCILYFVILKKQKYS